MSSEGGGMQPKFYLIPYNQETDDLVSPFLDDSGNAKHVQYCVELQRRAFCVDFSKKSRMKLGSSHCDITLPNIDRPQCQFKLNDKTGAVVLTDVSGNRTTVVGDEHSAAYLTKESRSVIVSSGINRLLFLGPLPLQFRLQWHEGSDQLRSFLGVHPSDLGPNWTVDGPYKYCYLMGKNIGSGGTGTVWRAVAIRTGEAMAVKQLRDLNETRYYYARREIRNMEKLCQRTSDLEAKHILPINGHESDTGEDTPWIDIFLPLKEGSVLSLVYPQCTIPRNDIAQEVLQQMAQALKFLERNDIIHRDIKPENILYDTRRDEEDRDYYHFLLADFGLAQDAGFAQTQGVGTTLFMPPEVFNDEKQTCKMDVWSLFVTVVWILDAAVFGDHHGGVPDFDKVVEIAEGDDYAKIRDMAEIDYRSRMSASDLVLILQGKEPKSKKKGKSVRSDRGDTRRGEGTRHEDLLEPGPSNYTHVAMMDGHSALPELGFPAAYAYSPDAYNDINVGDNYFFLDTQANDVDDGGNDRRKGKNKAKDRDRERKHQRTRL